MKFKLILLGLSLALFVLPALAQGTPNMVSFNNFSFSFDSSLATSVNITQFPGDAPDLQQPGGPEVAHTQFALYTDPPAPESIFDAPVAIRVYRTADFGPYEFPAQRLEQLQTLLAERPDLTPFMAVSVEDMDANNLPFMPVLPAAQVIRARAQFADTTALQGISYVTVYNQGPSPFTGSDFFYTFQGLSLDGAHYVSMVARLNTALFPAEIPSDFDMDVFQATFNEYLTESITTLNAATPTDFTPAMATLDALVQSFAFTSAGGGAAPTPVPAPTVTDETTPAPGSLGGLGGVTWTLVSYGPPDAPVAALPDVPVTLAFSDHGIGGSAGCNQYFGAFQFDVNTLTITDVGSTLIACEDQAVMAQEMAYLEALRTASSFQITDGQLQINYAGGVLTFTSGASQTG